MKSREVQYSYYPTVPPKTLNGLDEVVCASLGVRCTINPFQMTVQMFLSPFGMEKERLFQIVGIPFMPQNCVPYVSDEGRKGFRFPSPRGKMVAFDDYASFGHADPDDERVALRARMMSMNEDSILEAADVAILARLIAERALGLKDWAETFTKEKGGDNEK